MQSEGFRRSLTQGQPMVLAGSRPHDWAGRGRSRAEARTAAHRDLRVAVMVVSLEMGLSRRSGATQRADSPLGCWRWRQRGEQEARTRSTAGRTKPRAASGWTAFESRNTTMRQTQTDTRPMGTETRRADPGDPGGRWTSREQTGALGRGRITSRRPRRWREGEPRLQGQRRGGGRGWRRAGRYRCTQEATCRSRWAADPPLVAGGTSSPISSDLPVRRRIDRYSLHGTDSSHVAPDGTIYGMQTYSSRIGRSNHWTGHGMQHYVRQHLRKKTDGQESLRIEHKRTADV